MLRRPRTLGLAIIAFVAVVGALVAGRVGWTAFQVVRGISQPPFETLSKVRTEYFEVAKRVPPTVQKLNELLARYASTSSAKDLESFQQESREFKDWITNRRDAWHAGKLIILQPVTQTVDVGSLFRDLDQAFSSYLTSAQLVATGDTQSVLLKTSQPSRLLNDLASHARARAAAIDVVLSVSTQWRLSYRTLLIASSVIIAMILIWLGTTLYRFSFVPLHKKLDESRTVIEKQQKLAHFGELAAGLAHEIRNPLTAINARLFTLQKSIAGGTPEAEDATVIRTEINRLDRILKDFLKLARPAEPIFASMTPRVLFEEVANLLTPELQQRSINLKLDSVVETPFFVDPQQLKQVLINLIHNAAEAIGTAGTITLRARTGQKHIKGKPTEVIIIEVADTGPGIAPDVQERLFDPFYSTKEGGTGLGLPISAKIVDKHGGVLEFESHLGRGTTFGIVLPLRVEAHEA